MSAFGIFSDVHGNVEALKQTWRRLTELGLTDRTVLNAGDTVAYGDDSSDCIDFVVDHHQIVTVGGNYDYNVADFPEHQTRFARKWKSGRPEKYLALTEASDRINPSQREWLHGLPKLIELTLDSASVALCHYSPVGKKVGIGSWTTDADLEEIAGQCSYDVIVVGHTHTPFVRPIGKTLFINPGTVGRSWNGPTFAVLSVDRGVAKSEVITL